MTEQLTPDPLETAFVYPGTPKRPYPLLDIDSMSFLLIDMGLSVFAIMACIGILTRQKWSWFLAIALHSVVFVIHFTASIWVLPNSTSGDLSYAIAPDKIEYSSYLIASIMISLISLYLLSRRDVREYFRGAVKQAA